MAKECGQTVSHERIYQHIIEDKRKEASCTKILGGEKYKNRIGDMDNRGKIKTKKYQRKASGG